MSTIMRETRILARNIALAKNLETGAEENIGGALVVVHVDGESSHPTRTGEKGIGEVDVYLCHKQGGEKFNQLSGHFAHFYDYDFTDAEGDVVFAE